MKRTLIIHGFEELSKGQIFVEQCLKEYQVSPKIITRNLLISEEYMNALLNMTIRYIRSLNMNSAMQKILMWKMPYIL